MITLKELEWSNWFSYGEDNYIDFENSNLTQILGANGVGKSSIIHIIEEVLFNKNSRGAKKSAIMNRDAKFSEAKLIFCIGDDDYIINIVRKSSAKVNFYKNGVDISSHTATNTFKDIQAIIGMDFQTFTQLVYQNSKQGLEFLTSADSARKKFLISLFKLDIYTEYYEIFKKAYNNINLATRELEGEKTVLTNWLHNHKDTDFTVIQLKDEIDDSPLHIMLSEIKDLETKKNNLEQENAIITKNNRAIEAFSKFDTLRALPPKPESDNKYNIEKALLNKDITSINRLIRDLNSLSDSTCSTCLQPIDEEIKLVMLADARYNLESKQKRLELCNEMIDRDTEEVRKYNEIKSEHTKFETAKEKVDPTLPRTLWLDSEIDTKIAATKATYAKLKAGITAVSRHNKKARETNTKLETILIEMEKNRKDLEAVNIKIENANTVKSKLDVLKTVFSTKGLVSYKIDFLVKDLQDKINEYLVSLSDGRFQLNFMLESDSINIGIVDNGISVDISALSSGELSRVNVATLLAIRSLMSTLSNTKINILFLDEIMGVLDDVGKSNLIDILLNEQNLNTFIVSHEYTHPLLDKLYIGTGVKGSYIARD